MPAITKDSFERSLNNLQLNVDELHKFVHGDENTTVPLGRVMPGETQTTPLVKVDSLRRMVDQTKKLLQLLIDNTKQILDDLIDDTKGVLSLYVAKAEAAAEAAQAYSYQASNYRDEAHISANQAKQYRDESFTILQEIQARQGQVTWFGAHDFGDPADYADWQQTLTDFVLGEKPEWIEVPNAVRVINEWNDREWSYSAELGEWRELGVSKSLGSGVWVGSLEEYESLSETEKMSGKFFMIAKEGRGGEVEPGEPPPVKPEYVTYGVVIDLTNSNPETAVTYTDDAVGMTPAPYGGGPSAWDDMPYIRDIVPLVFKDGVEQYFLDKNNFNLKADGSPAIITGADGDVMIRFPKAGFQIQTVGNILTARITNEPNKEGFRYYAHTRNAEGDRDYIYIGAYSGSYDPLNTRLRSISGVMPGASISLEESRNKARANGANYNLWGFYQLTLLQVLFLIMYKHRDHRSALGLGRVSGGSFLASGEANARGMQFGDTTGLLGMKFLGIENLWGNQFEYVDGLLQDYERNILTTHIPSDFNNEGNNYTNRGKGATADIDEYIVTVQGTTETGFIPKSVTGGSRTTYFANFGRLKLGNPNKLTMPYYGGHYNVPEQTGIFAFQLYVDADYSGDTGIGPGRLMFG